MPDPVWLEKEPERVGRDHLCAQAASQTLYARLLPGIRNLTKRARSYTFYPWVLHTYATRVGLKDAGQFDRYVRRAAYILTLATALQGRQQDSTGAIGIDHVSRLLRSGFNTCQAAWAKGWNSSAGCRPRSTRRAQMTHAANCCMPRKWASCRS